MRILEYIATEREKVAQQLLEWLGEDYDAAVRVARAEERVAKLEGAARELRIAEEAAPNHPFSTDRIFRARKQIDILIGLRPADDPR
jgi:hypothetical protein